VNILAVVAVGEVRLFGARMLVFCLHCNGSNVYCNGGCIPSIDRSDQVCPAVEIDDDVWEGLKAQAEPLVDTPNTVLRRLLGLAGAENKQATPKALRRGSAGSGRGDVDGQRRGPTRRAPMGSLLPESAYESPILRALAARGGSAPARDVVTAVGEMVADRLTELDRAELPNGGQRWQSRVQFTRLRLKERGLIKSGSPRGLWELAEAGEELARGEDDS
jgi:hypothetical protein